MTSAQSAIRFAPLTGPYGMIVVLDSQVVMRYDILRQGVLNVQAGFLGNLVSANMPEICERLSTDQALNEGAASEEAVSDVVVTGDMVVPRLFMAQQQHLSLPQMRDYHDHCKAGEELDEDFEGNFS